MILSILIVNITGWALNRKFTFQSRAKFLLKEFSRYFFVNIGSNLLSLLLMFIFVSVIGVHYLISNSIIAIGMLVFNYIAHRDWSFLEKIPARKIMSIRKEQKVYKIVCITHYFPSRKGGIEAVAFEINRRLTELGVTVDWFASSSSKLPNPVDGINPHPVKAIELIERLAGIPLPVWLSRDVLDLWSAIRNCDAIHIHDFIYPGSLLGLIFAKFHRKPVILTQHIGYIPYQSPILRGLLFIINRTIGRLALRMASKVVFISNSVEDYFQSFVSFKTPPIYIPNGVDTDIFSPADKNVRLKIRKDLRLPEDARVCLFVGRFVEKKGLKLLAELVQKTPGILWLFAGEGPMHPESWKAKNVKIFEGWRQERLAKLYRAADLLILPSQGEGFPLVIQESFACGTPALVSDETAAGCEKAQSLLFKLPVRGESAIDQWQKRLNEIISDEHLLDARRLAVAEFSHREWSWEKAVETYSQLYLVAPEESTFLRQD